MYCLGMGTKLHCKSYMPVYHSMRDLNEDSSSSSWPVCYGDKSITSGQYCNGYTPRNTTDSCSGYSKDVLKRRMLEHEAVFKDQVFELHRLYRVQRNMMEEVQRKDIHRFRESIEPSSSSSHPGYQVPPEDAWKWQMAGFPLSSSACGKTSVSRVEIGGASTPSSTKGNGKQPCQFPYPNGSISKESEALDSRPFKVRKRLFDLQLPADECIAADGAEKLQEIRASGVSGCAVNADSRIAPDNCKKLNLRGHVSSEPDSQIVASSSAFCSRNSTGLADLNEPIVTDEANFLGHSLAHGKTKCGLPDKLNVSYISGNGKTKQVGNRIFINSIESKVNESNHIASAYEAGSSKANLGSLTHGIQQDKLPIPFHPVHGMFNPTDNAGSYAVGSGREDLWRVRNCPSFNRSRDCANNSHFESLTAPQAHTLNPFFGSSFTGSWVQPVVPWGKPRSSFGQKVTTLEPSAGQNQVVLGGNWHPDPFTISNQGLGGEPVAKNGFYPGSTSGSKDVKVPFPPGFDYSRSSWGENAVLGRAINGKFGNSSKGLCHVDSKPGLDINLNEAVSKGPINEAVMLQGLSLRDGKSRQPEDHQSSLPWLKQKPANAKRQTIGDLNQPFTSKVKPGSTDGEVVMKKEVIGTQNVTTILGIPIFEVEQKLPCDISTSASNGFSGERNKRSIDINLEYEPDEQIVDVEATLKKEGPKRVASVREYIDLNSCASDCEGPSAPSYQIKTADVKPMLEIDLEAPVPLDEDDNMPFEENDIRAESLQTKTEERHDEVLRNAAEAMVAISSFCPGINAEDSSVEQEASLADSLLWFVDALSNALEHASHSGLMVGDCSKDDSSAEIDDFEAMTLQLQDIKKEDCMPKQFVPEEQKVEEAVAVTNALSTRSRRGQSRRGRQRRDFQRDILPGLATLSRHEVTEDIQIFGGLMKATGHHWVSGLARRNGTKTRGARGRRRAVAATPSPVCTPPVQQFSLTEAGVEDRSLTGWGKTTRRPRRQRCPSRNPPTAVLTC